MTGNSQEDFREFLKSMTRQDARRYAGEWIAFAGGEIVAHGKDPRRVNTEGRKAGKWGGGPYMQYVFESPEKAPHWHAVQINP